MRVSTLLCWLVLAAVAPATTRGQAPAAPDDLGTASDASEPARAVDRAATADEDARRPRGGVSTGLTVTAAPGAELAGGDPGAVSSLRIAGRFGVLLPVDERVSLSPTVGFEWASYGPVDALARAAGSNPGGVPLGDFYQLTAGLTVLARPADEWRLIASINGQAALEDRTTLTDTLTVNVFALAIWRASDDLRLSFGLIATTSRGIPVIPVIGFDWRVSDDFRLAIVERALRLSWNLPAEIESKRRPDRPVRPLFVDLEVGFDSARYRLGRTSLVPDGDLVDRSATVGVGLRFQPAPPIRFRVLAGTTIYSELRVNDAANDLVESVIRKPHAFLLLEIRMVFG